MIYFDTSYLAKCYLLEPGNEQVRSIAAQDGRVACCVLGRVELAATFHRNYREGNLTESQRNSIVAQSNLDEQSGIWTWLPITANLLADTVDRLNVLGAVVRLRTVDALHLGCAVEHGFKEIYSNDRHLLAAASAFGIVGRNVIG